MQWSNDACRNDNQRVYLLFPLGEDNVNVTMTKKIIEEKTELTFLSTQNKTHKFNENTTSPTIFPHKTT